MAFRPSLADEPGRAQPLDEAAWRPAILVVDDDLDARVIYRTYLRAMGCIIYTAADGAVAVERAAARMPDAIVLDLHMPRMDGWETARRLRRSPKTRQIPIVALTGVPGARESAERSGCDAFLAKPCLPELLWWEIRALLRMSTGPAIQTS